MGSLLPLSNSRSGRRLFFRLSPLERNMEKTDAESVDDMVDASNQAETNPTPPEGIVLPNTYQVAIPVSTAVRSTPRVARMAPLAATGFISSVFVLIPPENRIMHRAIVPTAWAI